MDVFPVVTIMIVWLTPREAPLIGRTLISGTDEDTNVKLGRKANNNNNIGKSSDLHTDGSFKQAASM